MVFKYSKLSFSMVEHIPILYLVLFTFLKNQTNAFACSWNIGCTTQKLAITPTFQMDSFCIFIYFYKANTFEDNLIFRRTIIITHFNLFFFLAKKNLFEVTFRPLNINTLTLQTTIFLVNLFCIWIVF